MKATVDNPNSNQLRAGVADNDVDQAIRKSGYPLQTIVANKLRKKFYCQEEWSFIDRNTKDIRSIDIMAQCRLYDFVETQPRVRPTLNLLIECKQSELPYIFFLSPDRINTPYYPNFSGLFHKSITLSTDDDSSKWIFSFLHALDLDEDDFIMNSAPNSMTFSKCVRSGKDIILSGTESYQNLVLPLISSLLHFEESERPPKTAAYFNGHLPFAIGVLDAPMIGVTVNDSGHETELVPWVRIFRHESYENEDWTERRKLYAIDIVHKDYFDSFINKHLFPFVNKYAALILKHDTKIAEGKAFVSGLGKDDWTNIENRLEKHRIFKNRALPKLRKK